MIVASQDLIHAAKSEIRLTITTWDVKEHYNILNKLFALNLRHESEASGNVRWKSNSNYVVYIRKHKIWDASVVTLRDLQFTVKWCYKITYPQIAFLDWSVNLYSKPAKILMKMLSKNTICKIECCSTWDMLSPANCWKDPAVPWCL